MSISIDKIFNHSQNKITQNVKNQAAPLKKQVGRQFDEIVISSYKNKEEENVNKALATTVSLEVNKSSSEEKIQELKNLVDSNNYVINADEIAKKILGL